MKNIITLFLAFVAILSSICLSGCSGNDSADTTDAGNTAPPMVDPIDNNFRTFYQIFVGSFSDSNNDGVGDIRGIINRMDYLNDGNINSGKSLGVQGIWLSPIFSSPSYHKYDARDYYKIDRQFGTEDDLKELIALCKERNVKLILDLAINHTSTTNDWFVKFKEARAKGNTEDKYYDYYTCVTDSEKQSGITYQKISNTDCWYECNFSGDMPELNYDNPEVREDMLNVAKYYLDLGVDGFRFDAVKYIYYGNTGKSVEFWEWYMQQLKAVKPDIYCVGECWSGDNEVIEYYSALNCFNFTLSQAEGMIAKAAKSFSLVNYTSYIESYQDMILEKDPDAMIMQFLSNHDMDRIAGAFISENNMKMAANLYLLSSGSPVIYYGEELGMKGSRGSENTDANRRLAMPWGDSDTVRNPIGATYSKDKQIKTTVATQTADENSMYNYYCKLISVRHKYPAIACGDYTSVSCGDKNLGGFMIEYNGEKLCVIHNTSTSELSVDLSGCKDLDGYLPSILCEYIGSSNAKLEGTVLTLGAQTSVVIE